MDNAYQHGYERDIKREQYPPIPLNQPAPHLPPPTAYHQPAPPPHQAPAPGSPSASPFAFAPPPLQQGPSRADSYHYQKPTSYYNSAPLAYRSWSGEKPSPMMARTPAPPQQASSSPYQSPYPGPRPDPRFYTQQRYPTQYQMPPELPRSLSYGHNPQYLPAYPYPQPLPSLTRHNTTDGIERPAYAFAHRLPLTDRPFKCDECVQSFNRNHDLKRHKRIHLSVKPFGCDKCGKTFSRKDALRRHWLVKGCRGEEGATAPITPIFPLNGSSTPALTPPTPPVIAKPAEYHPHHPNSSAQSIPPPLSFQHPGAPQPLEHLPRQPSDQSSLLVTPQDTGRDSAGVAPMDEPMLDPSLHAAQRSSGGSDYFDGVVGLKHDGTALLDRRSPKPQFAMPFYQPNMMNNGAVEMEKSSSSSEGWQNQVAPRWHRPSFPFPPRQGNYYNEASPESQVQQPIAAPAAPYNG